MGTFPSGTVTFLFTDIEGSTRLSRAYSETWEATIARHHSILKSVIESNNGYIFQIIGDAFCAAFHNAGEALKSATKAQLGLQNETWGEAAIRVRMGIHTGEAELQEDGQYQSYLALSLVQRIMSAGHGGQVLLSGATENLLRGQLPDGINLYDMGRHNFKDVPQAVRVFQVNSSGLQRDFPPLASLIDIPNNLPTQLTSFIGREKEIEEVKQELAKHRLVTLTGSGGTGKTRLSLQVAAEVLDQFKQGVWFVELAPLSDPDLIPQTIQNTMGLVEQKGISFLQTLQEYLEEKKVLLVLDNCEHLIETCAHVANQLLSHSTNLKILASSREALSVQGEVSWRVPSLSLPDTKHIPEPEELSQYEAVQLFIERASIVNPHFDVNKSNASAIAQVCFRLGGIPLAIELAAARIKALSVEQINARLDDRFRLLTGGARTALPRQQTLRALIDWSYNLLNDKEKILFRRLAVFVGGWSLGAAESVCSDEQLDSYDILDLMSSLVDKSLLNTEEIAGELRYSRLETIRQYAREKLADDMEANDIRNKHLIYFLQLAEQAESEFIGPDQVSWQSRLHHELGNIRTALLWSLERNVEFGLRITSALLKFWEAHGYHSDGCQWLSQFLGHPEGMSRTLVRAKALSVQSYLTAEQGNPTHAHKLAKESLEIYEELNDKRGIAFSKFVLGYAICWEGDSDRGRDFFTESLALYRELNDKLGITETLGNLGSWSRGDDYSQARAYIKESLALCRKMGHLAGIGNRLTNLGLIEMYQKNYPLAQSYLEEGLEIHEQLGKRGSVFSLYYLGNLFFELKNYEKASAYYEESLRLSKDTGRNTVVLWSSVKLGNIAIQQDNQKQARKMFDMGRAFFNATDPGFIWILEGWAKLAIIEGRLERGLKLFAWADSYRLLLGDTLSESAQADMDKQMAIIHSQVDDATFDELWQEGINLTSEEAIDLAVEKISS